jgi:hypothetical protein
VDLEEEITEATLITILAVAVAEPTVTERMPQMVVRLAMVEQEYKLPMLGRVYIGAAAAVEVLTLRELALVTEE